jgi:hypothetical protein
MHALPSLSITGKKYLFYIIRDIVINLYLQQIMKLI